MSALPTTTPVRTGSLSAVSKNNEPDDILLTDLFTAYYLARSNKRNTYSQVRFERDLSANLLSLYDDIRSRKYRIGRSICFIVNEKVKREIFAASFRDRIVHHLLFNYLSPIFEPLFIEDSYSCRKGKGTLYGGRRLQMHMCEAMSESCDCAYILKLDIKSYFLSINKNILYDMVAGQMDETDGMYDTMLFLLEKVIYNDPTKGCRIKGSRSDWQGLPKSKSLFGASEGCGLPIGNLTSQLFSNIYLSALDDFVTKSLGFKHYGRYVDDFYIIDSDRDNLLAAIPKIRFFLAETLALHLHPHKVYLQHCAKGASFVGYHVTPLRFCSDRRTASRIRSHLLASMCDIDDPYHLDSILSSCHTL